MKMTLDLNTSDAELIKEFLESVKRDAESRLRRSSVYASAANRGIYEARLLQANKIIGQITLGQLDKENSPRQVKLEAWAKGQGFNGPFTWMDDHILACGEEGSDGAAAILVFWEDVAGVYAFKETRSTI